MKNDKMDTTKDKLSSIWQKTSDISKKAMDDVQKKAKEIAEDTKKSIQEQQLKKYTPITLKELKSKKFATPGLIEIVEDNAKRNIITDTEAVGWIDTVKDVTVLHLYYAFVGKSGLAFFPSAKINVIYCEDNFDDKQYINSENIFDKATEEKLAELENIAYMLGAKSCSVEIVDHVAEKQTSSIFASAKLNNFTGEASNSIGASNQRMKSGKTVTNFSGNNEPKRPELKWFANDNNILSLIEMRCSDRNSIKSRKLELKGSMSATMSIKLACTIDGMLGLKGGASMEKQVAKEHDTKLVYIVEF